MLPFSWASKVLSIFGSPITPLQEDSFSKASRLVLQVGGRKRGSNMCSHLFSQLDLLCEGASDDPPFPFSSRQSRPSPASTPLSKSQPRWGGDPQVLISDLRDVPTLLFCDCPGENSPLKAELSCSQLRTITEKSGVSFLKTSPSGSTSLALPRLTSYASLGHLASNGVRVHPSLLY